MMAIISDTTKRQRALTERRLDFKDAEVVFAGPTYTFEDKRKDYGELRNITVGLLVGRMVVVGWLSLDGPHAAWIAVFFR